MARRRIYQSTDDTYKGQSEPLHTPLDRQRIVSAVLDMLQAEGVEGIRMRKIADVLGVKAAALYYHVKDKEQLMHLLAEQISSEVAFPDAQLSWQEQLRQWALNFRRTLRQYRDAGHIMEATIAASPRRLAHIEFLFRLLSEAGFQDPNIPWLASMVKSYVLGFVEEETRLTDRASREEINLEELGKHYSEQFQSLPSELYPHMARLAVYTTSIEWDREFEFGLSVLLEGFEAKLSQASGSHRG